MADNVGYTPGNGATVAADDVGGVLYQRVKVSLGEDGKAGADLTSELLETLQAIRITLDALLRTTGLTMPDTTGRMRVIVDAITSSLVLGTVNTVSTIGPSSYSGNDLMPALMKMSVGDLRSFITVS